MDAEKEELNRQLQEKDMFFDTEKYIAWESELPVWKLEKNQVTWNRREECLIRFPK